MPDLSLHAMGVVAEIRYAHVPRRVKIAGRWFRRKVCVLCGQPWQCSRRALADDIEAGRRDIAGNVMP